MHERQHEFYIFITNAKMQMSFLFRFFRSTDSFFFFFVSSLFILIFSFFISFIVLLRSAENRMDLDSNIAAAQH